MVKILLQSEVSRYCVFQYVDRFLCADSDAAVVPLKVARVPCSKNEIAFSSVLKSMEKRMLQKFLQFCMTWKAKRKEVAAAFPNFKWEAHQQKSYSEFLDSLKIKGTLKNIICEVIAVLNGRRQHGRCFRSSVHVLGIAGSHEQRPYTVPVHVLRHSVL
ncbi:hypothetical protein L596_025250 [Steinernema carpocapsae]|uniref:Uncharacterized protein n=1 Tax=Steinernema carpocapsae TaxID=34508 RepID=A0A4V6XVR8_STECR|nr:hypothetical protein L596_025250 [Steinernema carpocapsae]